MKKILLTSICVICSTFVWAQVLPKTDSNKEKLLKPSAEKDLFSALDMKMLHDRQIVQEMMWSLYEHSQSTEKRDNITSGIFSEKDSKILETMMDNKKISYKITPELLKKTNEDPFEAFKDFIRTARVPKMTTEDIKTLNQVDKKAVSKSLQMITDSGPDVGAKQVSVIYDEKQN